MNDEAPPDEPSDPASEVVIEALSRADGINSTIRIYRDRIEWLLPESISSVGRPKNQPPVIPLHTVASVRTRKDGPLFSKVLLRTDRDVITFRMYSPQAVEVRDVLADLLAAGPPPLDMASVAAPPSQPPDDTSDDLRQLESLRDEGMLSAEEFEAARAQLGSR